MKLKYYKDYIDQVHEKFPEMNKTEINKILLYGFQLFYFFNNFGADVLLTDRKIWMMTGKLFTKYENFYKYYIQKYSIKLRILSKRRKEQWDGYYYFGLTDEMYRFYESQEDEETKIFENIMLYRIYDELKLHNQYKYYFKVKVEEYKGYKHFLENYETNNAELIFRRSGDGHESISSSTINDD